MDVEDSCGQFSYAGPLAVHEETHAVGSHNEREMPHEVEHGPLHLQVFLHVPHHIENDLALFSRALLAANMKFIYLNITPNFK